MKTSYQYFNAHAKGAMRMRMMLAVPVLTRPIWLRFLQMHINRKSANAHIAMYALHVLHNSTIVHKI